MSIFVLNCAPALQCPGQLRHGLVEGDVLEYLDDAEEHRKGGQLLERRRCRRQVREVGELFRLGEQRLVDQSVMS